LLAAANPYQKQGHGCQSSIFTVDQVGKPLHPHGAQKDSHGHSTVFYDIETDRLERRISDDPAIGLGIPKDGTQVGLAALDLIFSQL